MTPARLVRVGAAVGLVGIVAYCDFPLQWMVGSPLSPLNSYISELAVDGQPAAIAFRIGDFVAGIGLAALAAVFARSRRTSAVPAAATALAIAAVASIVDSLEPMNCPPSIDHRCWDTDHASLADQLSQLHTLSSVIGFTAVLSAIAMFSHTLCRRKPTQRLGRIGLVAAAAGTLLGGLEVGVDLTHARWAGLPERIQVCVIGAWLGVLALGVLADPRTLPRTSHEQQVGDSCSEALGVTTRE